MKHVYRNMAFDYAYHIRKKSNEGNEHPFAGVLKQDNEPYHTTTPYQEMAKVFIFHSVGKYLNCSFTEFVLLPYPVALGCLDEVKAVVAELSKKQVTPDDMESDDFFT